MTRSGHGGPRRHGAEWARCRCRSARSPALRGHWRLPAGRELAADDFAWRHRFVCVLVAAHLPVVLLVAVLRGKGLGHGLLEVLPVVALLAAVSVPSRRRLRAAGATLALLTCSAVLVHLFDGRTELHFHYFVAVAAVALYQDWLAYALAVGFVLLQHRAMGSVDGWGWAAVHAGFVLAEAAVLVVFWHASETSRAEQESMRVALADGESSVRARLEETARMRRDLIATVSHEFRTPLTGVRGNALTLLKRADRLDARARSKLLVGILEHQERLSRLLENMLAAAEAVAPDTSTLAEVDAVAAEVAMLAGAEHPGSPPVSVLVEPGTTAHIDRQALHQVLANLVDNAQTHGAAGAVPLVAGGMDEAGTWITVSNEGTTLDPETARRMFEPFVQRDSGATRQREGLGMGLYLVKRLVEVHHGEVGLRSEAGWTTVTLRFAPPGGDGRGVQEPRQASLAG